MVIKQEKGESGIEEQRREAKMWGRRAILDETVFDMYASPEVKEFARMLEECNAKNVIDAGCGSGKNSIFLAKKGYRVTAFDSSQDVLEVAARNFRKEGVDVQTMLADGKKIPAPDGSFDAAVCYLFLDRLKDAEREDALKEIARILKPGRVALVSGFFSYNEMQEFFKYFELYPPGQTISVGGGEDKKYMRILTMKKI